jgi:hypothetical protein
VANGELIPVPARRGGGDAAAGTGLAAAAAAAAYVPIVARVPISIRTGTMDDLPFIDAQQKANGRALGFLPTTAIEGKVRAGQVLVAEATGEDEGGTMKGEGGAGTAPAFSDSSFSLPPSSFLPVGYLIAADRYLKRDEVGYVTQLCVVPGRRRSLVAAQLLQAQFDRSAYGCRLYGCWCAQDLEAASAFWAAMGFAPIAFRTGSMAGGRRSQPRVHIFWQKRIRAGDEATPWWYPSQTGGGALRADRLAFPIPPGVSWRDVGPIVLDDKSGDGAVGGDVPAVVGDAPAVAASRRAKRPKPKPAPKPLLRSPTHAGGLWFEEEGVEIVAATDDPPPADERPARAAKPKPTIDPRLIAMSRELRDRWTERQADAPAALATAGKHDVKRVARAGTHVGPRRIGLAA